MERQWIQTPQYNWLYPSNAYCGIVLDLGGTWSARIENSEVIHPAGVTFLTQADAQAWVERTLADLLEEAKDQG